MSGLKGMDKYVAYLPNNLQMIINETLRDDVVWKEQCQSNVSEYSENFSTLNAKTHYIQIHSICGDDSIICSNSTSSDYKKLNIDNLPESEGCDDSQKSINTIQNKQTLSSILKETTV